jgi:hypothetical protein
MEKQEFEELYHYQQAQCCATCYFYKRRRWKLRCNHPDRFKDHAVSEHAVCDCYAAVGGHNGQE